MGTLYFYLSNQILKCFHFYMSSQTQYFMRHCNLEAVHSHPLVTIAVYDEQYDDNQSPSNKQSSPEVNSGSAAMSQFQSCNMS